MQTRVPVHQNSLEPCKPVCLCTKIALGPCKPVCLCTKIAWSHATLVANGSHPSFIRNRFRSGADNIVLAGIFQAMAPKTSKSSSREIWKRCGIHDLRGTSYAMLCYAMLGYARLCSAMLGYAMPCLCYQHSMALQCYVMLCYAMLCYAMLCYAMLCACTALHCTCIMNIGFYCREAVYAVLCFTTRTAAGSTARQPGILAIATPLA